jgi:hypothetical protein
MIGAEDRFDQASRLALGDDGVTAGKAAEKVIFPAAQCGTIILPDHAVDERGAGPLAEDPPCRANKRSLHAAPELTGNSSKPSWDG